MIKTILTSCLVVLPAFVFGASTVHAKGDAAKGKAKYMVCASCHGAKGEGKKALNAPRLAGQQGWYLTRQLKHFKAGIRGTHAKDTYGKQMRPMAMTLATAKDIQNVVAYIKTFKAKVAKEAFKGNAVKGKAKYMVCASCHGAKGKGKKALNAPALAGQQGWYLARQLKHFKAGIRGTHAKDTYGKQMRPMAMTLATAKDIQNVVAYIKTFK